MDKVISNKQQRTKENCCQNYQSVRNSWRPAAQVTPINSSMGSVSVLTESYTNGCFFGCSGQDYAQLCGTWSPQPPYTL